MSPLTQTKAGAGVASPQLRPPLVTHLLIQAKPHLSHAAFIFVVETSDYTPIHFYPCQEEQQAE